MAGRKGGLIAMCIAFPGLVVEVDAFGAVVDTEGRRRRASTLFLPDIAVGDWVAVAAGTIVERLEPDHAAQVQEILRVAIALEAAEVAEAAEAADGAARVVAARRIPGPILSPDTAATASAQGGATDVHSI